MVETALRKHAWSNRAEQWRACENKNPARVARAAARHVVKKLADWFFHGIAELSRKKLYTNVDLYTYSCTCTYHMLQESSFGLYIHDSESFRRLLCEEYLKMQAPNVAKLKRSINGSRLLPPSSLLPARPGRSRRECRELTGSARGNLRRDLLQLAKDMLAVARLFEL